MSEWACDRIEELEEENYRLRTRIAELERTRDAIQADANKALEKHRENTFALQNEILAQRRELQRWRTSTQIEGDYVDDEQL